MKKLLPLLSLAAVSLFLIACSKSDAFPSTQIEKESTVQSETTQLATSVPIPTTTPVPQVKTPRTTSESFRAGVSVLVYGNDSQFSRKVDLLFDRLVEINVNSVSLTFPFYQAKWYSSEVSSYENTLSDENIREFIRKAHNRGLEVMLRPVMDEKSLMADPSSCSWSPGPGQALCRWRGNIAPQNPESWFNSYSNLITHYAQIAATEKAEMLSVGVELDTMTAAKYWPYWNALCAQITTIFTGELTYADNHNSQGTIPCIEYLSFIGIDAFYKHTLPDYATEEQLADSWRRWLPSINHIKQVHGKPVVFTEIGLRSQVGAYKEPWLWETKAPVDLEAQRAFFSSLCSVVKGVVSGFFVWSVGLDQVKEPEKDPSFEFLGKPAEQALASCYGQVG